VKKVSLLVSIYLVLVTTVVASCSLRPTPDPVEIQRLVAEAVQATIEAMPTATPYPTYTPVLVAPTYTPPASVNTPRPTHTVTGGLNTPESQVGSIFRSHIVVAGDTLSGLAKEYGTTVEAIVEANELSDASLIVIGQVLSIPVEEAGPAETPIAPTPSLTPTTALTSTTTTPVETPPS
jgi:LysM repeat protein